MPRPALMTPEERAAHRRAEMRARRSFKRAIARKAGATGKRAEVAADGFLRMMRAALGFRAYPRRVAQPPGKQLCPKCSTFRPFYDFARSKRRLQGTQCRECKAREYSDAPAERRALWYAAQVVQRLRKRAAVIAQAQAAGVSTADRRRRISAADAAAVAQALAQAQARLDALRAQVNGGAA